MQTFLIRAISGLFLLIGIAPNANADASISLIWAASGTSDTAIATSSSAILRVILTNDAHNIGASVSIDYSNVSDQYSVVSHSSLSSGDLPLIFPVTDTGAEIINFSASAMPPYIGPGLAAGQSYQLASITFHKFGSGGNRTVSAFLGPDDAVAAGLGGGGVLLPSQITLSSATLIGGGDPCGNNILDIGEDCDDGNIGAGDCCSPVCEFEPNGSPCNDGDACTTTDSCDGAGSCDSGAPLACDDLNLCTEDSCVPASGCVFVNNSVVCDDSDACTTPDTCAGGSCQGPPLDCDDLDNCTSDSCDMVTGCFNDPIPGCGMALPSSSDGGRVLLLAALMIMAGLGLTHYPRFVGSR